MSKIFVYGSLKKGFYNNILLNTSKFIKTTKLNDFALYSLGAYPAICPLNTCYVKGEIYEVDDVVKKRIDNMELNAGYHIESTIIDGDVVEFYVYNKQLSCDKLVYSGEW